jgi:large subunit ribosomal protein L4
VVNLKKYSLEGKELGSVEVPDALAEAEANGQMVKDYIIALRANARQWSANTKGRSEVNHTTKKPHPQKGQGRARQGSLAAPQYKGGGRVFGPKPKFDQRVKINKKEKKAALRYLIASKLRNGQVIVIKDTAMKKEPKTKELASFLNGQGLSGKRVLFVGESQHAELKKGEQIASSPIDQHQNFIKSMRNIPKTQFALSTNVNGYDLALAHQLVVTEKALQEWQAWLDRGAKNG